MSETNAAAVSEKPKFIVEYQHTDDKGNPLIDPRTGKALFTNLTAETAEEMIEKQKRAHIEVTRALYRARTQKAVPKEAVAAPRVLSPEEERQAAVDLADPAKAREAIRKLSGVDDLEKENEKTRKAQQEAEAQRAAYTFMSRHIDDYYPCSANSAIIAKFVDDNELDPRVVDNYEIAFSNVYEMLAKRPAPQPEVVREPEAVREETRKPSGGIQPGELSGASRPRRESKNELVTKQQIAEWRKTPEGRAEYKKRLRDPKFVAAVDALFAKP